MIDPEVQQELNELRAMVQAALNLRGDGTATVTRGGEGMIIGVPPPMKFRAKITVNYGDGSYAWVRMWPDDFTAGIGYTQAADDWAPAQGNLADGWLAWEAQQNPNVPIDTEIWLRPHFTLQNDQQWEFDWCCGSGAIIWNVVSVTLAAGTYNNYALTAKTGTLLITATGAVIITGFSGGLQGRLVKVEVTKASTGSSGTVTLPNESGSSSASNRVMNPNSWDEVLNPGASRAIEYNTTDNRWLLSIKAENPVYASNGTPSIASVTGNLALDTNADCAALYVYFGSAWHHTAGGGLNAITANTTAVELDYTKDIKLKSGASTVKTYDLPNTGISDCWHVFYYNEPATSLANSASLRLTIATVFHGVIFSGGGGYTQADGSGGFYSWGVEQYRISKTISGSTYTVLPSDENLVLVFTNSTGCAVTLPQTANTGNFVAGFRFCVDNKCSAGNVVITPTISTIDELAAIAVQTRCSVEICADGANYNVERGWAPTGVTEYSTTPQSITAGWHGRNNVYTGSSAGIFNEPATLPTGMLFGIVNAGSGVGTTLAYTRVSGVADTLRRGDGFILNNVASGDAGTAAFATLGVMRNGGREVSSNNSCTRDDNNRVISFTGSSAATQTLYTIDATNQTWDTVYSIFFKNNGTANWTIAAGGSDTINGAASILLGPCQGIHLYAIAAAKWIGVTGTACVQYGTIDPTYTAPKGTPYLNTTSGHFWVNSSGSTTWTDVTGTGGSGVTSITFADGLASSPNPITGTGTAVLGFVGAGISGSGSIAAGATGVTLSSIIYDDNSGGVFTGTANQLTIPTGNVRYTIMATFSANYSGAIASDPYEATINVNGFPIAWLSGNSENKSGNYNAWGCLCWQGGVSLNPSDAITLVITNRASLNTLTVGYAQLTIQFMGHP